MTELAKAVYLEAAYQHDMIGGWGWERFSRAQWATDMLPYSQAIQSDRQRNGCILKREAHTWITAWFERQISVRTQA